MNSVRPPVVMVGVSGSAASAAALRWAADEARRRHAELRVVHGWDLEQRAPYAADPGPSADQQQAAAYDELAGVLHLVFGSAAPAPLSAELVPGAPERVLIDRSAEADLLVLGSAGREVGPVVRACLHRARCPVVVVGAAAATAGDPAGAARRRELVGT